MKQPPSVKWDSSGRFEFPIKANPSSSVGMPHNILRFHVIGLTEYEELNVIFSNEDSRIICEP